MSIRRIQITYGVVPSSNFMFGTDPLINGVFGVHPTVLWGTLGESQRRAICIGISNRSEVRCAQLIFQTTTGALIGGTSANVRNENVIYGTPIWVPVGQLFSPPFIGPLHPYGLTDGTLELLLGTQQEDFESMIFPPHSSSVVSWVNEVHNNEVIGAETNYKYVSAPMLPPSTNFRYVVNYRRTLAGNIPGVRIYGCVLRNPFAYSIPVPPTNYLVQEQLLLDQPAGAVQHTVVDGAIDQYFLYKVCFIQNGAAGNTDGSITIGPQP